MKTTTSENYDIMPLVGEPIDYSEEDNWLRFTANPKKEVDLIYIYPTIVAKSIDESGVSVIDTAHITGAQGAFMGQGSALGSYTNVYSPLYRQIALDKSIEICSTGGSQAFVNYTKEHIGRTDIFAALDYYFQNINNNRPFILSGHSQGSTMLSHVMSEYMRVHPEYLKNMVVAYAIGFPFGSEWLKSNPHLKYAEGELDTGCIVSWNTEGPGAEKVNTCIAQEGAYVINPLNWKTDESYAGVEMNSGSLVMDEFWHTKVPGKGSADAQIDKKRGALICTTQENYPGGDFVSFVGDKSLHGSDYDLYYMNIMINGLKRIKSFIGHYPVGVPVYVKELLDTI